MTRSSAEYEIREAVVQRLRDEFPSGRIIHELNCEQGRNRIDVACVTPSLIISVEIKSEKDTLKRLADQVRSFQSCSHFVIVAAHEIFFEEFTYNNGLPGFRPNTELFKGSEQSQLWLYPRPDEVLKNRYQWRALDIRRAALIDTRALMRLMWADELRMTVRNAGIQITGIARASKDHLTKVLWSQLTGAEITAATCRYLRAREFAEADPRIGLEPAPDLLVS